MKRALFIAIGIVLLNCLTLNAQYMVREADKEFALFNYKKAIGLYEQSWKRKETLHTAQRLAMAYQSIRFYKETESWSAIAADMQGSPVGNVLNYAKALQNNGKYGQAKQQYQKYMELDKMADIGRLNTWILSCDSAIKWMANVTGHLVQNEKILNSIQSDWAPVAYKGGILFTSDRPSLSSGKQVGKRSFIKFDTAVLPDKATSGWTGGNYFHLFFKGTAQDSIKRVLFPVQTSYHVGPASFNVLENEVYFALTRIPEKFIGNRARISTINVEVYSCKMGQDGKWSAPQPFAYNNVDKYSIFDPIIGRDGNMLYFSSDMPGGKGGTDLYVCLRTADGSWGRPINMEDLNTEGNERSISFDSENNMYFSSDGRVGMGGLDIYLVIADKMGTGKMDIKNMGYPINSPQDDFAFNANIGDGKVYFSSNRPGGLGSDDIYSYPIQKVPVKSRLEGPIIK